jgi:chemotaxis family two-component system response regulator Rcp1
MTKPIHLLLVEDNEDDIVILKDVLAKHNMDENLAVVRDGEEALAYIYKQGVYSQVKTPDIMLLDLNLPKKNGFEVLKEIRGNETYKQLPILVLSTSNSPDDITESYLENANCFITKPVDIVSLYGMVEVIKEFWINTVQLPHYD